MRTRRAQHEHDEAVARRLAQLSAELAVSRTEDRAAAPETTEKVTGAVDPAAGGEWWEGHTRVAPARRPLTVVPHQAPDRPPPAWGQEGDSAAPPAVPMPGRHAARRRRVVAGALPDPLRGRVLLGPAQVTVVAVLVALGLAATAWWVVRGRADPASMARPLASAATGALVAVPEPSPASPAATVAPAAPLTVDVAGKVRRPGIQVLDAGARVVDAIEAAGGARPGVNLTSLNLARPLVDGEQVLVGSAAPSGGSASLPAPAPGGAAPPLVSLNAADQAELETLPEVGPVTAQAILAWRDEHGGFSSVEELLEVDGIGDATLARIAPYVTI
ncbi:helix-hairpin-helix domain-containing protein [Nocardioides sp. cx-169]|uniref:helix-hairpin-helix domain-containing protein n=1 Tax=Nocardioides sp. cx-169 TaxID=2899080 RepID=UPI001E2ACC30|nr:helix-hairpin-helix domain-containing protein [Nocardioides sp. cx-169]MCD4534485.1 helix-hairpin-helix domain-containing protein [Nocardioides sp. cx-169]